MMHETINKNGSTCKSFNCMYTGPEYGRQQGGMVETPAPTRVSLALRLDAQAKRVLGLAHVNVSILVSLHTLCSSSCSIV